LFHDAVNCEDYYSVER